MPRAIVDPRIQAKYALKLALRNPATRSYWLTVLATLAPAIAQAEARRRTKGVR